MDTLMKYFHEKLNTPKNAIASRRRPRAENDSRDIRDIQRPNG